MDIRSTFRKLRKPSGRRRSHVVAEWFDWCKGCLNVKESVAAPLVRKAAKQAMFIGKAPFFVLESRTDKMNRSPLFLHPTRVIMKKTDGKPEKSDIFAPRSYRKGDRNMTLKEAMLVRHCVREYLDKPIPEDVVNTLRQAVVECNRQGDLHIQLVTDEPRAFDGFMAHYGKFSGVSNYIALIGKKSPDLSERCGYYGEKLVLLAQTLGLNSCWVGLTYSRIQGAYTVDKGEKLVLVIAVGYGKTQGLPRKTKTVGQVSAAEGEAADWFVKGVDAALNAPTALNQQKFFFIQRGDTVEAKAGTGFFTKVDLGIAKYHFELGAGKENFRWI